MRTVSKISHQGFVSLKQQLKVILLLPGNKQHFINHTTMTISMGLLMACSNVTETTIASCLSTTQLVHLTHFSVLRKFI